MRHFGRPTRRGLKKLRVSKIGKIGKILQFDLISQRDEPRFFLSYRSYQAAHTTMIGLHKSRHPQEDPSVASICHPQYVRARSDP